jgi:hypothetical protein
MIQKNVKALFELGKYDKAIQSLKLFIQIQKGNSIATIDQDKPNEMITICQNKLIHYQKKMKTTFIDVCFKHHHHQLLQHLINNIKQKK